MAKDKVLWVGWAIKDYSGDISLIDNCVPGLFEEKTEGDDYEQPVKVKIVEVGKREVCAWENFDNEYFESSCDYTFSLSNDGNLKENNLNYCPNCGKKIVEVKEEGK